MITPPPLSFGAITPDELIAGARIRMATKPKFPEWTDSYVPNFTVLSVDDKQSTQTGFCKTITVNYTGATYGKPHKETIMVNFDPDTKGQLLNLKGSRSLKV